MIVIALSWIILLLFFIPTGMVAKSFLKIQTTDNYLPIFLGIFLQCVGLCIFSFFFKIGWVVFLFNFLMVIGLSVWKSKEIKSSLKEIKADIQTLPKISKIILATIFVFALFKCAQSPFIIDNESYYVQTIKWINEYGFVKGLANLHIYLGQNSPFHVLQAGFNFSFLTDRINDINGFLLVFSSVYFITEFEKRHSKNAETHWIGFIPIFNILFFQFINAPSPDLSIILVSQILFYYFLDKDNSLDSFKIVTLLFLYLIFIKITIAPLGLLVIYLLHFDKKRFSFLLIFGSLTSLILILKNSIITGYPFYPFYILPLEKDWKIPQQLLEFIASRTKSAGYIKVGSLNNASLLTKLNSWLHLGGINRVFNIGMLVLFAFGLFINKIQQQIKYKILYLILGIHFVLLLLTSPQFRFFLPEFVFLSVLALSTLFNYFKMNSQWVRFTLLTGIILPLIAVPFIDYKNFTANKLHQHKEKYNWYQILIPEKNSKYAEIPFEKIKEGNLDYYSPKENFFFYGTANGDIPCVNKVQVEYFKNYYYIKPQLRTSDLSDGFYSKSILNNE
ncbi:LIC_10190 family membrane protein [Flavobacterium eburneipallidum]|uniref:LIC_10190 family membrane protein n=1 Tax=Flavobacterium eburneipallidum TaxID=3003263 RepID=UPI0022AC7038|nr:hypothetical protein [Flavobacterium eburneipallidum]